VTLRIVSLPAGQEQRPYVASILPTTRAIVINKCIVLLSSATPAPDEGVVVNMVQQSNSYLRLQAGLSIICSFVVVVS
jgi:hypothetical protein